MPELTHKIVVDFFENINLQLKDFSENSFFRMDLDELFGAFRSGINFPAMSIESPEGDGSKSLPENSVIGRFFAFTIWQRPQKGNFDQQNIMLDECERIGLKIIARMRYESKKPDSILYNKFKASSVSWKQYGPLFNEKLYGYRFQGTFEGNESLKLNPDDWNDIATNCP